MTKKANELIFISQINRDGSGTTPVSEEYLRVLTENKLSKDDDFKMTCLSITNQTWIATNFNSFVVKIK